MVLQSEHVFRSIKQQIVWMSLTTLKANTSRKNIWLQMRFLKLHAFWDLQFVWMG